MKHNRRPQNAGAQGQIFLTAAQKLAIALVLLLFFFAAAPLQAQITYTADNLVAAMQAQNTELRKAREEYVKSLLDIKDAKAGFSPTIDLTVSGSYLFNPPVGPLKVSTDQLLGAIDWPSGMQPPKARDDYLTLYKGMENTLYSFQLDITQPLFTWGKITSAVKLYEAVSQVRDLQLQTRTAQLRNELYSRLSALNYLGQIRGLLAEQSVYAQELVAMTQDAEKNGVMLRQDVLEAQIQAKELTITQKSVEEQFNALFLAVRTLTGIDDLGWENIGFKPEEQAFYDLAKSDPAQLEQAALDPKQNNLLILDKLETVSEHAQKIANASVYWKPDLALKVSLGYGGPRFPLIETDWFRQDDYGTNITLAIKTTIWDGGKKLNDLKRTKSDVKTAAINRQESSATILRTLREQYNSMDLCLSKIEYLELKTETAQSKIMQQQQLSDSGSGSRRNLLQAKIELCTTYIEYAQQKIQLTGHYYTIKTLIGDSP